MSEIIISVQELSKRYSLGQIGARTFREGLERWWHRLRGRDPEAFMAKVSHGAEIRGQRSEDSLVDRPASPRLRGSRSSGGQGDRESGKNSESTNERINESSKLNEIWALRDVSFEVGKGEVLGIIGRNGAGKSTLLKILTRITEPTSGRALLHGRVASLLEVGTGFHPELTGRENVYLNGTILGMKKTEIDLKFDEIVEFSGVGRFMDTPVKRYSSGMYVRLAFAVAAHLEPEILLIDEVLAVGDVSFQRRCLGKMGEVAKEGRTVLFVSHNMTAVANLCPKSILLEEGEVVAHGPSWEVIEKYVMSVERLVSTDLRHRTDRKGEGRLRFVDTWVEGADGKRTNALRTGDSVRIVAEYECGSGVRFNSLHFAFALNTARGVEVADLSTKLTGDSFEGTIPARGRVACRVPRLPLNRGTYFYNIFARSSGGVEDWVQQAGKFDVQPGDYFGTGQVQESDRLVMMDQEWHLVREKSTPEVGRTNARSDR